MSLQMLVQLFVNYDILPSQTIRKLKFTTAISLYYKLSTLHQIDTLFGCFSGAHEFSGSM